MKQLSLKQRGVTLLELLITLAIAAIITSLAIPAFANTLKRSNSTTIAYQMMGLVQFARTEAISHNTPVTLCGSSDGASCNNNWSQTILIFTDYNGDGSLNNHDSLLKSVSSLKSGESLAWHSFRNKPYLQLEPNGMTYFQNGNFTYCPSDGDEHYAVHWIVNVTGHLRIAADKNNNGIPEDAAGKDISC